MHIEMGKAIVEARQEVEYGASFLEWFAEEGRRRRGDILESNQVTIGMLRREQFIALFARERRGGKGDKYR